MLNNFKTNKEGFTLIELLLYTLLVSVLMMTVSSFIIFVSRAKVKNQIISEVEQQGINISYLLSKNIKAATSVTAPLAGASSATLAMASSDVSRNPTVFKLASGAIVINLANGTDIILNNTRVTASNFLCSNFTAASGLDSINCHFILSATDTYNRSEYSYSKTYNISASHRY